MVSFTINPEVISSVGIQKNEMKCKETMELQEKLMALI